MGELPAAQQGTRHAGLWLPEVRLPRESLQAAVRARRHSLHQDQSGPEQDSRCVGARKANSLYQSH